MCAMKVRKKPGIERSPPLPESDWVRKGVANVAKDWKGGLQEPSDLNYLQ